MKDGCPIPLIGQAWVLCGFDFEFDVDQDRPRLYAAEGETPLLNLPASIADEELEGAFCEGFTRLFYRRFGVVKLVQAVRAWDAIVERLGGLREEAGD